MSILTQTDAQKAEFLAAGGASGLATSAALAIERARIDAGVGGVASVANDLALGASGSYILRAPAAAAQAQAVADTFGTIVTQTIGRAVGGLVTGTSAGNTTWAFKATAKAGKVAKARLFSSATGTFTFGVFRLVSGVWTRQGSSAAVNIVAGANEILASSGAFTAMPIAVGDVIFFHSTATILYDQSAPTGENVYFKSGGQFASDATIPSVSEQGPLVLLEAGFDIEYAQTTIPKLIPLTQAQYDALAVKDAGTLYAIKA